jgi:hypothetical protein
MTGEADMAVIAWRCEPSAQLTAAGVMLMCRKLQLHCRPDRGTM